MSRAVLSANRVALVLGALLAAFAFAPTLAGASQANASGSGSDAGISIINGKDTSINDWPWQVGLTIGRKVQPNAMTSRRFFCGGSILTPRIVVTAGHCVEPLSKKQVRQLEIVSGRTRLNSNRGQVVRVTRRYMPLDSSGKRRYRTTNGTANWDVALLTLAAPLKSQPIKLAGPDESEAWAPGRIAWTTGWGVTKAFANRVPANLKVARQVIMNDGLCKRSDGSAFHPATMNCLGGPGGNASACSGDSGGPLVVDTSDGYRLVGLTSFGDGACRGFVPSVDARVSGPQMRNWVAKTVKRLSGHDVVGTGGEVGPAPVWCRVPAVFGLKPEHASKRLEAAGCRLGKVRTDRWAVGRRGRIVGYSRFPGWLASPGFRLNVWLAP